MKREEVIGETRVAKKREERKKGEEITRIEGHNEKRENLKRKNISSNMEDKVITK